MKNKQNDDSQPPREASKRARVWAWLGDAANQKTLRFLGAAVAAAVALLATAGLIHGPGKGASEQTGAGASQPSQPDTAPAARQEATAGDQGIAANVHGNGNAISIGGKP